jgi:hypothetical protein
MAHGHIEYRLQKPLKREASFNAQRECYLLSYFQQCQRFHIDLNHGNHPQSTIIQNKAKVTIGKRTMGCNSYKITYHRFTTCWSWILARIVQYSGTRKGSAKTNVSNGDDWGYLITVITGPCCGWFMAGLATFGKDWQDVRNSKTAEPIVWATEKAAEIIANWGIQKRLME